MEDAQSAFLFFTSQLAPETFAPAAPVGISHGDHGDDAVTSLTAGRVGCGDLGEGRGVRIMLWPGAAEEPKLTDLR